MRNALLFPREFGGVKMVTEPDGDWNSLNAHFGHSVCSKRAVDEQRKQRENGR